MLIYKFTNSNFLYFLSKWQQHTGESVAEGPLVLGVIQAKAAVGVESLQTRGKHVVNAW
jgi:hypothetical protein